LNKSWFKELLDTLKDRVKEGSEFKLGPSGVSVGQAPVLPDNVNNNDVIDDGYTPDGLGIAETTPQVQDDLSDKVSLTHRTSFWKMKNGRPYYRIFVNTHAQTEEIKNLIAKVVYQLHPTFKNPIRAIISSDDDFLLKTNGWGEFIIKAEVHFSSEHPPVKLNRYIDFKA